jgi:hypothetical protein
MEELESRTLMNVGPIAVSANHHYLIDPSTNQPFLYVADTAWDLFSNATVPDAENYLLTRKNQGFTAIQAGLAPFPDSFNITSFNNTPNAYGVTPFLTSDLSQPNPAYFSYVKQVMDYAAQINMEMVLNPFALSEYRYFVTPANASAYCSYIAKQLGNYNNITWFLGGDFDPGQDNLSVAQTINITNAEASAIQANEAVHHIMSYHSGSSSSAYFQNSSWLDFNMIEKRDWDPTTPDYISPLVYQDYNLSPTKPTLLAETVYEAEGHPGDDPYNVRRNEYDGLLAGALGVNYGHAVVQSMPDSSWKNDLTTPGAQQMTYMANLLTSRAWYNLVPDQAHTVLTSGYGSTTSTGVNDYAPAEIASDGSLFLAYIPTDRTVTIDLSKLAGTQVKAQWFDPTTGQYTLIGTFAKTATSFTTPSFAHGDGSSDWILVLDAVTSATATAAFVKTDTTTQGNWNGVYGSDGYNVSQDANVKTPSYAQVGFSSQANYTWAASTSDVRAVQKPENLADHLAACWYSGSSFTIDVNLTDGKTHAVALYALDWDSYGPRSERIDVLDAGTGTVLNSQTVSSFVGGQYLVWNVSSHVQFQVTNLVSGRNAVISGLFFGTSTTTTAGAPAGYWKFDEGSGTTTADASGNGATGMLQGGVRWSAGRFGAALQFNGTSGYVNVPAPAGSALDLNANPVTLAAWINTNSLTTQQAILLRGLSDGPAGAGGTQGYGLWINANGHVNLGATGGGNFDSLTALTPGWHQVTGIINGTASKVYIDGVDQTPAGVNVSVTSSNQNLIIGASRNNANNGYVGFFSGVIDDLRIYNRVLSTSEVRALAQPALVSNLAVKSSNTYQWATLTAGQSVYSDRSYSYVSVPSSLNGQLVLQTANSDKQSTDPSFISFTVNQSSTVYVMDAPANATLESDWLNAAHGWTLQSFTATISTASGGTRQVRVWSKTFAAGSLVTLGGNEGTSDSNMYTVVIVPN